MDHGMTQAASKLSYAVVPKLSVSRQQLCCNIVQNPSYLGHPALLSNHPTQT